MYVIKRFDMYLWDARSAPTLWTTSQVEADMFATKTAAESTILALGVPMCRIVRLKKRAK